MKATLRIPTEQYAYIEVELEKDSFEEVVSEYRNLSKLYKGGTGLPEKDFMRVLDRYLWGDAAMTADEFAALNEDQQIIIQAIKRSRKRDQARHLNVKDLYIPGPGKGENGDWSGQD